MSEKPLIDKPLHIICWIVIALLLPFLCVLYYTATNEIWIKILDTNYEITYPIYFVVLAFLVIVFPHIVLFMHACMHTEPPDSLGTLSGHELYEYSKRYYIEGGYDYITWEITWS